jgi:hypothetical protein
MTTESMCIIHVRAVRIPAIPFAARPGQRLFLGELAGSRPTRLYPQPAPLVQAADLPDVPQERLWPWTVASLLVIALLCATILIH